MKLTIQGKGINVSDYLEEIVQKKARKFERYFKDETEMVVKLSIEKNRHIAEVSVPSLNGAYLRAEESSASDLNTAVESALKKLERKIRKHRTRLERGMHEKAYDYTDFIYADEEPEDASYELVRRKNYSVLPMTVEEAENQMELLGHNFFVFVQEETDEVNVLYRRRDGNYGLLEPEAI